MKYFIPLFIFIVLIFASCSGSPAKTADESSEPEINITDEEAAAIAAALAVEEEIQLFISQLDENLPVSSFKEIWGYVVTGRESSLTPNIPLTDIGYFSADVNVYGTIGTIPDRRNLPRHPARVHLVVTCGSQALTYFTLMPESPQRRALIADLIAATSNYDGLQIDFEYIPARSREPFQSFLRELRAGLPSDKMFTVAYPARTRRLENDIFDYELIKPYVDRILIMAYDEHWSTSRPGPVASFTWCRNVADYGMRTIGAEKLIMGLPLYGRAWVDTNHHRALIYQTTASLYSNMNSTSLRRVNTVPSFNYDVNVNVTVYYDDEFSLSAKMQLYKSMGVNSIGFWRVGQETTRVWNIMSIER
ncbi:MAG: glycosyl hydrolase family 18 protein [Treponema sp.]|nr:glycosyl hydrolase family 18 protein [Treponema sp.]